VTDTDRKVFQGLSVAIKTVGIVEELMEIWPNEVCDNFSEWGFIERASIALAFISEALEVVNAILLSV